MFEAIKFDDKNYLDAKPDVMQAIEYGRFLCGLDHYKKYEEKKGRRFMMKFSRFDRAFSELDQSSALINANSSLFV